MSNSNYAAGDDDGPPPDDDRPSVRRSRSRSPPRRSRRRSPSRSRSRSRDRSKSPHSFRGGRGRDRSPPRGGSRGSRGRRSPSRSGSRSRSPIRGGRDGRDRFRDRGPPPGYGPVDDFYGMRGGYDRGPHGGDYGPRRRPPPNDGHFDPYGRGGGPRGEPHGPPRGGSGPPPRDGGRGDRRRGEGPPGISLLVRNVGPQVTTQDLQMAFGRIGHVRDVYIPRDYHSQQPKGFAFIEYADADMAREARDEMDRFRIKGCELEVVFAQEHRKSPNEMRGRVVNHQNRGRDGGREGSRDGGRSGGRGFERSSSFERHKQRRRDEDTRDGGRHQERGSGRAGPSDGGRQNDDEGGKKQAENGNTGDDRVRRGDSDVED